MLVSRVRDCCGLAENREISGGRQYFCVYFAAPILLYIFLHFCLVCANNLVGADILELLG
jgi:hypothetical protein